MKQQFTAKHPWTILAAGAAIQVLTGIPAAWGVFQQPVMDEYGLSEQGAGYAFGVLIAFFGIGCVIGGFLQDKHGPRFAALWGTGLLCGGFFAAAALPAEKGSAFFGVFSIPAGLGTAFLYPSIQSCAQKWYKGRKGLATGVIGGAVGLSGAFLTVFVRTALRGFGPVQGIRGAFWALGALTLPVCLAGSALLTDPPPEKPRPSQQDRRLFRKALAHGSGICGQNPAVRVGAAGQGTAFRRAGQHQLDHRLHAGKVHQPGPGAQRTLHTKGGSPPVSKAARCGSHTAVIALVALRPALRQQGGDLVLIQLMHQRFPPLRFGVKDV